MNINIISKEHTASMFRTKMFLDDTLLRKYFKLFTSMDSNFPLPDNQSESPMWHKVYHMIYDAATI
jgi:hypothetical protein